MARVTVEDCLKRLASRFELVHLALGRARMLCTGAKQVVDNDNRKVVTALKEIAKGRVCFVKTDTEESRLCHRPIGPAA